MSGLLTLDALREAAATGDIDTVLLCQVDMQARLMGKRLHVSYFLEHAEKGSHSCNYLLATDQEMEPVEGYEATSWQAGYGDYHMVPDLATLRVLPWLERTALVLADVIDDGTHEPVPHSPRAILRKQIERLDAMGLTAVVATELEFFLFHDSYREAHAKDYRNLELISPYNEDYHIFQTSKEEAVMQAIRNGLYGAGIPVEGSKGEAAAGQEEINILHADPLTTADNHVIAKNGCKEIAWAKGKAITFMAKWNDASSGSSSHVHQSLWSDGGKTPIFYDPDSQYGMSTTMRQYLAGLLAHASDVTYFLAPNINSYKRFAAGTFAPTRAIWSLDNRTAGYRLCGANGKSVRVECRVGGSDLNPYLALASQIAAGLYGIEHELELEDEFRGDAYQGEGVREVPKSLREATVALDESAMLRDAFGDEVIDHYLHAARWEQQSFDAAVTDWETSRGFERS